MNKSLIKLKLLVLSGLLSIGLSAQDKLTKVSQSIEVDKDVTIDLNTSYCNIVIDTWNKNEVAIEAYIEGEGLSNEEMQEALKHWKLDVDGSQNKVSIRASRGGGGHEVWISHNNGHDVDVQVIMDELKHDLAEMSDVVVDIPEVPAIPELPPLPPLPELPPLPDGINAVQFDYEAYQKEGEKYLEEWSKEFESKYGEDYAKKMEEWGKKFADEWSEKYGKDMKEWGEKFGLEWQDKYAEKMAKWGEAYAKKMERHAKVMEKRAQVMEKRALVAEDRAKVQEERAQLRKRLAEQRAKQAEQRRRLSDERRVLIEKLVNKSQHSNVKKTIIIKMPKKAKLKVNVTHGELEFAAVIDDVQADLSYTKFKAQGINGSKTSISAAYAPVYVSNWNLGELNLNHVRDAQLKSVKHVVLNANSSNIKINNIVRSAIIDSNIGDLKILDVGETFTNLNFILQNNQANIVLPKIDCNMNYRGKNSVVIHPANDNGSNTSSFSISYPDSNKTIVVNAKYSTVIME